MRDQAWSNPKLLYDLLGPQLVFTFSFLPWDMVKVTRTYLRWKRHYKSFTKQRINSIDVLQNISKNAYGH